MGNETDRKGGIAVIKSPNLDTLPTVTSVPELELGLLYSVDQIS